MKKLSALALVLALIVSLQIPVFASVAPESSAAPEASEAESAAPEAESSAPEAESSAPEASTADPAASEAPAAVEETTESSATNPNTGLDPMDNSSSTPIIAIVLCVAGVAAIGFVLFTESRRRKN